MSKPKTSVIPGPPHLGELKDLADQTVADLGGYLREQRQNAQLTLRQLADLAGVSNPYLSQVERGLRRPSAEVLGALAGGLRISAESLYIQAGLLQRRDGTMPSVMDAVNADPRLGKRQRKVLIDMYRTLVDDDEPPVPHPAPRTPRRRTSATTHTDVTKKTKEN